jgi:outer membrane protein OmpA-like peptidoglycan-associated protein
MIMALVVGVLLAADASAQEKDVPRSKDHPLISRYAGSVIVGYDTKEYDELVLPLAGIRWDDNIGRYVPAKSQKVEGKLTRILYLAPKGRSTLEIFRNYENELKRAGFQVLFSCSREAGCKGMNTIIYPEERQLRNLPDLEFVFNIPKNDRYLAAELPRSEGNVYVSLYMAESDYEIPQWIYQRIAVLLEVVEAKPMEGSLVRVDASAWAQAIATQGKVALYGIYFDTDKAEIKPESKPTLAEIAKLLKQDLALKLYVVGHTDAVGSLEYNMELSRRRAEATVRALVSEYGVDPRRLKPFGVGPLVPVASNDTEQGRAKNRRVELVKQ